MQMRQLSSFLRGQEVAKLTLVDQVIRIIVWFHDLFLILPNLFFAGSTRACSSAVIMHYHDIPPGQIHNRCRIIPTSENLKVIGEKLN
jgi:hypothetical protein